MSPFLKPTHHHWLKQNSTNKHNSSLIARCASLRCCKGMMVASDREKWSPPTAKTYLFLRGFALRPARVMFARHLIGLSSCLQKSPPQLCHHLFRITRVLVCCRRHFPGRGCFSSCEASRARGRLRAIKSAIFIRCSYPPPPLYSTRIFWSFSYRAHML